MPIIHKKQSEELFLLAITKSMGFLTQYPLGNFFITFPKCGKSLFEKRFLSKQPVLQTKHSPTEHL